MILNARKAAWAWFVLCFLDSRPPCLWINCKTHNDTWTDVTLIYLSPPGYISEKKKSSWT